MPETTTAGVTPAVAGVTPAQTPPAGTTSADPNPPVTGGQDPAADPDRGAKTALEAERKTARDALKRASEAEKALDELRLAGASDAEKAVAKAKAEGAAEATERYSAQIRRSEVKAALVAAGINDTVLDLAVRAEDFAELKVTDEGTIEGLDDAVARFKKAKADLFGPRRVPGADLGAGSGSPSGLTVEAIRSMTPAQYAARRDEVMTFLGNQRK